MSDLMDISSDLEKILLKPLEHNIKYTFRGWKSLALLHSWDEIVYKDINRVFDFQAFDKKYKYICQNEKDLYQNLKNTKIKTSSSSSSKKRSSSSSSHKHSISRSSKVTSSSIPSAMSSSSSSSNKIGHKIHASLGHKKVIHPSKTTTTLKSTPKVSIKPNITKNNTHIQQYIPQTPQKQQQQQQMQYAQYAQFYNGYYPNHNRSHYAQYTPQQQVHGTNNNGNMRQQHNMNHHIQRTGGGYNGYYAQYGHPNNHVQHGQHHQYAQNNKNNNAMYAQYKPINNNNNKSSSQQLQSGQHTYFDASIQQSFKIKNGCYYYTQQQQQKISPTPSASHGTLIAHGMDKKRGGHAPNTKVSISPNPTATKTDYGDIVEMEQNSQSSQGNISALSATNDNSSSTSLSSVIDCV